MANKNIGEVEIILGKKKKKFTLRLNFLGLVEMENRACVGMSALSRRIAAGICGLQDITSIVYGGMVGFAGEDKEPPLSFEELGQLIVQDGLMNFIPVCTDILTFGMTGKWPDEWKKENTKKKE